MRPYADTAHQYWAAGWANPIPVKGKWPPPPGYTGYDGANVSYPDLQAWVEGDEAGHNIAVRLPGDIVGIDVDAHDGKAGERSLAAAEAELGPLPPTVHSTSRAPFEASGIRFYRVPPGANLRGAEKRFRARFGDHVDIIRRDHRYAVVWPSVHPETGGTYRWYASNGAAGDIPAPATLAQLPEAWVAFLTVPAVVDVRTGLDTVGHRSTSDPGVPEGTVSPWDLPRQFTREQAAEFVRPHFEALRTAPNGTINNRLNDAAVAIGHFVPIFWTRLDAVRWLNEALAETAYDGRTWRAETTIASGLGAKTWRAELLPDRDTANRGPERPLRRGDFVGVRNRKRAEPQFVTRDDGKALLYPAKDSYLYAETESGKSWLAALAVVQCVTAGIPIIVFDFEEGDELEYGNRLLDLGIDERRLTDPSLFRYIMVDGKCTDEIMAEALDMGARVVINEGMSVAYDVYGWQVKENDSATAFRRTLVKPHLVAGRAVLTTDHVVKDRDSRGRYAIGGVMKLNAASGGAFLLVNVEGLAPGRRGASNLYVTKDRPGGVKRHGVPAGEKFDPQVKRIGTLVVDDSRTFVNYLDVKVLPPARGDVESPAMTPLSAQVLAAIDQIREAGRLPSLRAVRAEVGGHGTAVDGEIERLLTRGLLTETREGRGGGRVFNRVQEISEEEEK